MSLWQSFCRRFYKVIDEKLFMFAWLGTTLLFTAAAIQYSLWLLFAPGGMMLFTCVAVIVGTPDENEQLAKEMGTYP